MQLEDILQLEGIVIRKIPLIEVRVWRSSIKVMDRHKEAGGEYEVREDGKEYMIERKRLSLGGKYLIQFESGQDSIVLFNRKTCGIGDTIEEAFQNYKSKRG